MTARKAYRRVTAADAWRAGNAIANAREQLKGMTSRQELEAFISKAVGWDVADTHVDTILKGMDLAVNDVITPRVKQKDASEEIIALRREVEGLRAQVDVVKNVLKAWLGQDWEDAPKRD